MRRRARRAGEAADATKHQHAANRHSHSRAFRKVAATACGPAVVAPVEDVAARFCEIAVADIVDAPRLRSGVRAYALDPDARKRCGPRARRWLGSASDRNAAAPAIA